MKIIYRTPENTLTVVCPAPNFQGTINECAEKCVPTGFKYKIVEDSDFPSDREFRHAWEVDEAELTDGVGT